MTQEKINLIWHTYTDHLREMLQDMMTLNEMTDVTLISEDKKQFKAHKVVLSASSPVFKNIITGCSLSNPLIYLRGIQSFEIESILQFIYLGEAKFYQDRMNEFINVAKNLEIKEISIDDDNPEKNGGAEKIKIKNLETDKAKIFDGDDNEKFTSNDSGFPCNQCDKHFTRKDSYCRHVRTHKGIKYPCTQCEYKATQSSDLQRHIKSIHDGFRYKCTYCNSKYSQLSNLNAHFKAAHGYLDDIVKGNVSISPKCFMDI